ncbi:MAG TPA: discoidin domain-containing protein [Actinoplanes sp.]
MSKRLKAGLATLVVGVAAAAQFLPTSVASAAVPPAPAGFALTWSDDFNGAANTGLDTGVWRYDAGAGANFGTGEIETTTTSTANVYQDGQGHLVLKALHTGTDPNSGWTSGRVETQADAFGAPDGGVVRIESVLKQPDVNTSNGLGYWPAYWMVGSPLRVGIAWPGSGEIDVMENINGHDSLFSTLHCGGLAPAPNPCNEYTGIGSGERACAGCKSGFHKYAVEIDRSVRPEQIRYYLDNTNIFTINSSQVDATTWNNAVHHNFTPIYDLAIGGQFPAAFGGGPTAATVSGGHLDVDYLAVYNKAPAAQSGWGSNVAAGRPATSSSNESATFPASNVTDNDPSTRWSSGFSDPQWVQIDLGKNYNLNHVSLNWEASAAKSYQIQTSTDGTNWATAYTNTNGTGEHIDAPVSGTARYVRVNGTARLSQYGYSLYDLKVWSTDSGGGTTTPPPGNTLLSQGKPTTASSSENTGAFPASAATDGNTGTRWSSAFSDPQWLQVDLGATHTITSVNLNWEAAAGKAFQIQTSNDGTNWTNIYSTTAGTGGNQTLTVSGSGRYVRMNGTQRTTQYGYSLWEFGVYGS